MAISFLTTDGKACGAWSIQVIALDPICLPAAAATLASGLKVVFAGSMTTAACTAVKTCAGFCTYNKASATERVFCWMGAAKNAAATLADPGKNFGFLITNAIYAATTNTKDIGPWTTNKNFEWMGLPYEGESNVESTADVALAVYLHSATTAYARFSYWNPLTAAGTTAGIPPLLNMDQTLLAKCLAGEKVTTAGTDPKLVAHSTPVEKALGGTAVVAGSLANSYKAGAGKYVLTRPVAQKQAATANSDPANRPLSDFDADSDAGKNCQGSWIEVAVVSASTWSTAVTAEATLATYSMGLMMTLRIRLVRADKDGAGGGHGANLPLALCVKLGVGAALPNGATASTTPSALCFFNASQGLVADTPSTDSKVSGFKSANSDTWQTVALIKPAKLVKGGVVGTTTGVAALAGATEMLDITAAKATTYKGWGLDMTPTTVAKNADCIGSYMGSGTCLLGFSIYLPQKAGTASQPFKPQNKDTLIAQCQKSSNFSAGQEETAVTIAGLPNDNDAPGNPANATATEKVVPATKGITATAGSHAMLPGTAAVPLTAKLDVAGLDSTGYAAAIKTATQIAYTDGYTLTSRITMFATNTFLGRIGVCYQCVTATTCAENAAYCHQVTAITVAVNMPPNTHSVVVSTKAQMALAKKTDAAATPAVAGTAPLASASLDASAGLVILAPVKSTAWTKDAPTTKGCHGCLAKPVAADAGKNTNGMLAAQWYQPLKNGQTTGGPRFDSGLEVKAWGFAGTSVVEGTKATIKLGAAQLAAAAAGVALGAAALAM